MALVSLIFFGGDTLIVTTRNRESEILTDYKDVVLKGGVNQNGPLSFYVMKTPGNSHCFHMIENENFIEYDGHQYRIKESDERLVKNTPVKIISVARHRLYDIIDTRRETVLTTGAKSISTLLSFIFTGTRWTFSVIDSFGTKEFKDFGKDNCLALFNKVIERFGAEFEIVGNDIRIRKQIGSYIDMQFRYGHNIKTFKKHINTNNLSTRIYGTGKLNEDGTPVVSATYISPNASLYTDDNGNIEYKDAPSYSNETITNQETLIENMVTALQDEPDVSFELEFSVLQDAGYTKPIPERGDVVPTILEELGIDVDLRIMEIELYPESFKSPKVVLANYKKGFSNSLLNYQKSLLDKIWDENSKTIRYDVYNEAVKMATEALNNSLTELEYPIGMGIIARDPIDANKFVAFRSSGLGITSNGGLTFDEAITALGVNTSLLTAGQIKTNNIQIVTDDGLLFFDGNGIVSIDETTGEPFFKITTDGQALFKGVLEASTIRTSKFESLSGDRINFGDYGAGIDTTVASSGENRFRFQVTDNAYISIDDDGRVLFWKNGVIIYEFMTVESLEHRFMLLGRIGLKGLAGDIAQLQVRNYDDTDYLPIAASDFITSSSQDLKKNIELFEDGALEKVKSTSVYKYHRMDDDDRELKRVGFLYEQSIPEIVDPAGNGVIDYAVGSVLWKALQELAEKVSVLESKLQTGS